MLHWIPSELINVHVNHIAQDLHTHIQDAGSVLLFLKSDMHVQFERLDER